MAELRFGPVGKCIYCGAERYNDNGGKLHDEHIIPYSLNGRLVLDEASCQLCERLINQFEEPCNKKLFGPVRYWMGLATRNPKRRPETLWITLQYNYLPDKLVQIPTSDYPVGIGISLPDFPAVTGRSRDGADRQIIIVYPATFSKFQSRCEEIANQFRARNCSVSWTVETDRYRRLIAKIGHAYAVAVLGTEAFEPLLCPYIMYGDKNIGKLYVGITDYTLGKSRNLHDVWLDTLQISEKKYVIVHVRLFGCWFEQDFVAVVGIIKSDIDFPAHPYNEPNPGFANDKSAVT